MAVGAAALLPFAYDEVSSASESLTPPRVTMGVDHFRDDWSVVGELHYNGTGGSRPQEYGSNAIARPAYQRGEVYLLGRYYAGLRGAYQPTELTTLALGVMTNLIDPSAILTPSFAWQLAQDVEIAAGGFVPLGAAPEIGAILPQIRSEFGSAPYFLYVHLVAHY